MPLLKLETTVAISEDKRNGLLASLSKAVAGTIGKPEQYVVVSISQAAMVMSGKPGDAAFVDVRSIGGLSGEVNRKLSQQICKLLNDSLGIPPERAYVNFADVDASNFTVYKEEWNYGFPQEMAHFVDCVQNDKQPLVTGEDGRAVLEAIFAAYESARTGRKVNLPFKTDAKKPHDLWKLKS